MKSKISMVLVAVVLGFGGFVYYQKNSDASQLTEKKKRPARTIDVTTQLVEATELTPSIALIGKLEAQHGIKVTSEVVAKVDSIEVKAGDKVKKGQLLIKLDDEKVQASVVEAQAYLRDEQRKLVDFSSLVSKGAVTQTEVDGQRAAVDIAVARLNAAKAFLTDYYLSAPFDGTVSLIDFIRGQFVTGGSELMNLDDLSKMRLDLQVPEQYIPQLSVGTPVVATSRAWSKTEFYGQISAIDSRVNPDSLNIRVRVMFDNVQNKLKPGMLMSASIDFAPQRAPIVPVQALEYSGTKRFVYVVDEKGVANRSNSGR